MEGEERAGKKKKNWSGQMSFICPSAQHPWSRWLDCHDKLCLQQENMSHPWGRPCATFTFSPFMPGCLAVGEQVAVQLGPRLIIDMRAAAVGIEPTTFRFQDRVGGPHCHQDAPLPLEHCSLITAARWPLDRAVRRENVSGPDDLFLLICRFLCISLLSA